jgi:hypothetical protein
MALHEGYHWNRYRCGSCHAMFSAVHLAFHLKRMLCSAPILSVQLLMLLPAEAATFKVGVLRLRAAITAM